MRGRKSADRFLPPRDARDKLPAKVIALTSLVLLSVPPVFSDAEPKSIAVQSPAFKQGAAIPKKYTGDGADLSPALVWSAPPKGAKSLALTCEDPDAPKGTWWHWILFNMPASMQKLGENVPKTATLANGVLQGSNDFGKVGYNGPAPPPGHSHHYQFKVTALDTVLNLKAACSKDDFCNAVRGHVLAQGQTTGIYWR